MAYSRSEQETTLVFNADTGKWMVYSTVPKHIRKLSKLTQLTVLETEEDGKTPKAVKGILEGKQVSMKTIRILSDEQRERASARMAKMHEKR